MIPRLLLAVAALLYLSAGSRAGDAAFHAGDYAQAAHEYRLALERDPTSGVLHFNLAAALLRIQEFDDARRHLEIAARSENVGLRQGAHYNGGNSELFPAIGLTPGAERDALLHRSIASYREALLLDPDDFDAKWNLELAELLLSAPPAGGAGGGGGGGDGGADGAQDPAPARPEPAPEREAGAGPPMSSSEAERVIEAAASRDRELHQEKLRRPHAPPPGARDW
jgi:tetratricopeptide (TPR) repeat protein